MASGKKKILFLSSNNSIRSQIAEALYRNSGNKEYETQSAGLNPTKSIHPLAIRVMNEIGIDISKQKANSVRDFLGKESFNTVVILCPETEQQCPRIWLGISSKNRFHWPLQNPALVTGTEEERLIAFRLIRDQLRQKIVEWIEAKHKNLITDAIPYGPIDPSFNKIRVQI